MSTILFQPLVGGCEVLSVQTNRDLKSTLRIRVPPGVMLVALSERAAAALDAFQKAFSEYRRSSRTPTPAARALGEALIADGASSPPAAGPADPPE